MTSSRHLAHRSILTVLGSLRVDITHGVIATDAALYPSDLLMARGAVHIPLTREGEPPFIIELALTHAKSLTASIQCAGAVPTDISAGWGTIDRRLCGESACALHAVHEALREITHQQSCSSPQELLGRCKLADGSPAAGVIVCVNSALPPGLGLGGSLAIQSAIVLGVYRLLRQESPGLDLLAQVTSRAARQCGDLGGFNDSIGSALPGVKYTSIPIGNPAGGLQVTQAAPACGTDELHAELNRRMVIAWCGIPHCSSEVLDELQEAYQGAKPTFRTAKRLGEKHLARAAGLFADVRDARTADDLDLFIRDLGEIASDEREAFAAVAPHYYCDLYRAVHGRHPELLRNVVGHKPCGAGGTGAYFYLLDRDADRHRFVAAWKQALQHEARRLEIVVDPQIFDMRVSQGHRV